MMPGSSIIGSGPLVPWKPEFVHFKSDLHHPNTQTNHHNHSPPLCPYASTWKQLHNVTALLRLGKNIWCRKPTNHLL